MRRQPGLVAAHYTMLCVLAFLCVAPILVIFATSLRQQVDIFGAPLNFIFTPTLENYRAVLQEDKFDRYLGNSLIAIPPLIFTFIAARHGRSSPASRLARSRVDWGALRRAQSPTACQAGRSCCGPRPYQATQLLR